jgi:hypothetical protein
MLDSLSKFLKDNRNAVIIVAVVIILLGITSIYLISDKNETYSTSTKNNIPNRKCKVFSLTDISEEIKKNAETALVNADPETISNFSAALADYSGKVKIYNAYPDCSGICLGGQINTTSGICECPKNAPIPYVWKDNIYCIENDLSNISGAEFNPEVRKFSCGTGTYNVSGNNLCYNSGNKATLEDALRRLKDATKTIQTTPSEVASTYGKIGKFFVSGQAALPTSGLTLIANVTGVTSAVTAAGIDASGNPIPNSSAGNANFFAYNPQTSSVAYYTASPSISAASLSTGTLTIGTDTI